VFERLGLRAFIVLVPGHAFAGYAHADGTREFLETTLLGAPAPGLDADARAARNVEAARRAGRARWRSAAARMDGRHAPAWALIDIGTARAYGIIPLAVGDRANTTSAASRRGGTDRSAGNPCVAHGGGPSCPRAGVAPREAR
jgi:hypothetical protein